MCCNYYKKTHIFVLTEIHATHSCHSHTDLLSSSSFYDSHSPVISTLAQPVSGISGADYRPFCPAVCIPTLTFSSCLRCLTETAELGGVRPQHGGPGEADRLPQHPAQADRGLQLTAQCQLRRQ